MNAEEAVDRFSEAFDGELTPEQQEEFERALALSPETKQEYDDFCDMLRVAGRLGLDDEEDAPDIVAGVQSRIRSRSRGQFYRDRFSTQRKGASLMPMLIGVVMILVVVVCWLVLNHVAQIDS